MLTVTLTRDITDYDSGEPHTTPAGTVVKVIGVRGDYLEVETLDGAHVFPVELDEIENEKRP